MANLLFEIVLRLDNSVFLVRCPFASQCARLTLAIAIAQFLQHIFTELFTLNTQTPRTVQCTQQCRCAKCNEILQLHEMEVMHLPRAKHWQCIDTYSIPLYTPISPNARTVEMLLFTLCFPWKQIAVK